MRILAIETSGSVGSVAIWEDGATVREESFQRGLVHGKALLPTIARLLEQAGWEKTSLGLIAVSQGPGSYTGVRVGVATAKALAYALGCPILGVSTMDALALGHLPATVALCPVVDARWEQVYTGLYQWSGGEIHRVWEPRAMRPDELARALPEKAHLFGDGLKRYGPLFQREGVTFGGEEEWVCHAHAVASLAARDFALGRRDDAATLVPLYLRPTEAEVKAGKA